MTKLCTETFGLRNPASIETYIEVVAIKHGKILYLIIHQNLKLLIKLRTQDYEVKEERVF